MKELWEKAGWNFEETETSYKVSTIDGFFQKVIMFNKADERYYAYLCGIKEIPTYTTVKPMWIDKYLLKLIRKSIKLLKWNCNKKNSVL